MEPIKYLGIVR